VTALRRSLGLRPPRRTVRLRLTLLYGALFLVLGTALLGITYLLVSKSLPTGPTTTRNPPTAPSGAAVIFQASTGGCHLNASPTAAPSQVQAQAQRCLSEQRAAELSQLLTESGVALAIMTVVSIGLGWLVAGRMLGKLRTITAAARSVSASSLHARLAMAGPDDELKELGDTFDGLLARLEAAFGAQRQFVANASHELRTPLARQRTLIEVALADPEPSLASLRDVCQRLLVTGEEQERLIEALLTLARSQRGLDRREPVDLAAVADGVLRARWPEAEARGLAVTASLQRAPALGDTPLTERLVTNLVENAIRHNVPGGAVEVGTGTWAARAILSVFSTGPSIPPDQVERLFRPFQRGAPRDRTGSRNGLGLGLSIVAAVAEAHGAWWQAHALPGGGLGIRVGFPLAAPAPPPNGPGAVQVPPAQAPPAEAPPAQAPPAEAPSAQVLLAQAPPAEAPPVQVPPAQVPPAEAPTAQAPPAEAPPARQAPSAHQAPPAPQAPSQPAPA
jgi:signal transduction histidine kinase